MDDKPTVAPDSSAVRTALWRAMHVQVDPPPHILEDEIGFLRQDGWPPAVERRGLPGRDHVIECLSLPAPSSAWTSGR